MNTFFQIKAVKLREKALAIGHQFANVFHYTVYTLRPCSVISLILSASLYNYIKGTDVKHTGECSITLVHFL